MTTLAVTPTYPVPARACKLVFTLTNGGNFLRVWVTDAPDGSRYKRQLVDAGQERAELLAGDGATRTLQFEPDVGGKYLLAAQEYIEGATTHGGGYQSSEASYQTMVETGAETALVLTVGERITHKMGTPTDSGTLVVWVWDDYVRATTVDLHGELSPAITEPSSQAATAASLDTTVLSTMAAMIGQTSVQNLGDPSATLADMLTKYNAHIASGTFHAAADTDNDVATSAIAPAGTPSNPAGLQSTASIMLQKLGNHYANRADGEEVGASVYHTKADFSNGPLAPSAGNANALYALMGDLAGGYEAHRVNTDYHGSADNTNALAALPRLVTLHRYFFASLRTAPTAPATENQAAVTYAQTAGFKVS